MRAGERFGRVCLAVGGFNLLVAAGLVVSVWLTPGGAVGLLTAAGKAPAPEPGSPGYGEYQFGVGYVSLMTVSAGLLFGLVGLPFALLGAGALIGAAEGKGGGRHAAADAASHPAPAEAPPTTP